VITNFQQDLRSEPARRKHAQLRRLQLPTLEDIEDEFAGKVANWACAGLFGRIDRNGF
jgi:hypothetical protein